MLNVAGIQIQLNADIPLKLSRNLKCFISEEDKPVDLTLSINSCDEISIPDNILMLDITMLWNQNYSIDDKITICITDLELDSVVSKLQVNKIWNEAVITYYKNTPEMIEPFIGSLGEILFRNSILFHQGIVVHAAAIEWKGKGILFSAPSGTGKSTQADLWKKYKGSKMINEDRPAIRKIDDTAYVYGTLWNGSSVKYRNCALPLEAIVILRQATDNNIVRLETQEAITMLMPRCFLPYYQEDIMDIAINNLVSIINITPVYLLDCRPDSEAVELVCQCVK